MNVFKPNEQNTYKIGQQRCMKYEQSKANHMSRMGLHKYKLLDKHKMCNRNADIQNYLKNRSFF